jgi:hypothetical protein
MDLDDSQFSTRYGPSLPIGPGEFLVLKAISDFNEELKKIKPGGFR